ncbi:MAG: hypothetical protein ACPLRW_11635 [Moorellales bacterium]
MEETRAPTRTPTDASPVRPGRSRGAPRASTPEEATRAINPVLAAVGAAVLAAVLLLAWPGRGGEGWRSMVPGQVLASSDAAREEIQARDYSLVEPTRARSDILYIWDWGKEDGDVVEILVNGKPMKPVEGQKVGDYGLRLSRTPVHFKVPASSTVEVVGMKDGAGGGITYALWPANLARGFPNRVAEGQKNVYRLAQVPER